MSEKLGKVKQRISNSVWVLHREERILMAEEVFSRPVAGSTSDSFFRVIIVPEKNRGIVISSFHFKMPRQCIHTNSPFLL